MAPQTRSSLLSKKRSLSGDGLADVPAKFQRRVASAAGDQLVSNFLASIIRFWHLILEKCPSSIYPQTTSQDDRNTDEPKNTSADEPSLTLTSLFLREQLDGLREWEARFTDKDLDHLLRNPSSIGKSVLDCLVNIANALLSDYVEEQDESLSVIDLEARDLCALSLCVEELMKTSGENDTVMTEDVDYIEDDESVYTETTVGEAETAFVKLEEEIKRLKRLSSLMRAESSDNVSRWLDQDRG